MLLFFFSSDSYILLKGWEFGGTKEELSPDTLLWLWKCYSSCNQILPPVTLEPWIAAPFDHVLLSFRIEVMIIQFSSVQFSSFAQSCPTLCDPMNRSMPGLPVHHQLLEFTQTHIHRVRDAIQPSHPLSSPSPPAPNPSQHQSLFQ